MSNMNWPITVYYLINHSIKMTPLLWLLDFYNISLKIYVWNKKIIKNRH